jgi:hypothetical protein
MDMQYLNFVRFRFLFFACMIVSISLFACENKEEKTGKRLLPPLQVDEMLYRQTAVLLSVKYGVDEDSIFNLLKQDNDLNSLSTEEIRDRLTGTDMRTRIETYSKKYNLSPQTVASILIDNMAMHTE